MPNEYDQRYAGKGLNASNLRGLQGPSAADEAKRKRSQASADLWQMLGNVAPLIGGGLGAIGGGALGALGGPAGIAAGAAGGFGLGSSIGSAARDAATANTDSTMQPFDDEERKRQERRQAALTLIGQLR